MVKSTDNSIQADVVLSPEHQQNKSTQSNARLIFAWVLLVYVLASSGLLVSSQQHQVESFKENLQKKLELSVRNTSAGLQSLIVGLESSMGLFVDSNTQLLRQLIAAPSTQSPVYKQLYGRLKQEYPDLVSFTLADQSGRPIMEHFDGLIGEACKVDIKSFVADKNASFRRLHQNLFFSHFDIMSHTFIDEKKGVFFANFQPSLITKVLQQYEPDGLEFMLLDQQREGLIEFTADGERGSYHRSWRLSSEQQKAIRAFEDVPRTQWRLVAFAQPEYISNAQQEIKRQSLLHFCFLIIGGILLVSVALLIRWQMCQQRDGWQTQYKALEKQAHHDPLTGLPNRLLLHARLDLTLEQNRRNGGVAAVLFLDIDRFKTINDTNGHEVGDKVLISIASELNQLRGIDTVARWAGDEFIVVLGQIDSTEEAGRLAQHILNKLGRINRQDYMSELVTASIGIAVFPQDGDTVDVLVTHADSAMYRAKKEGRNTYRFYTDDNNT